MSRSLELFPAAEEIEIPGLTYVPEFVQESEEQVVIRQIEAGAWTREFARRRQHFGMDYSGPKLTDIAPLPEWIEALGRRILQAGLFTKMPSHALVNEYLPGQGIAAHKDYAPFTEVASLSLASPCMMEFKHLQSGDIKGLWLEARSLLVLTGEARHEWTHAIRPRKNDMVGGMKIQRQRRLSLTFRTV
jgi:alkylated DNA repair dioxygenase AlkB